MGKLRLRVSVLLRVIPRYRLPLCSWSMVLLTFMLPCISEHLLCAKHALSIKRSGMKQIETLTEDSRVIEGTQTGVGITQETGGWSGRCHWKKRNTFTNPASALVFLSWKKLEIFLYSLKGNRHISYEIPQSNPPFLPGHFYTFTRGGNLQEGLSFTILLFK